MTVDLDNYDPRERAARLDEELRRAERQTAAIRLRNAGASLAKIASACGYADTTEAERDISAALAEIRAVPAADMVARQIALTQDLIRGVMSAAMRGDVDAVKATVGVMDHQAKLLGLYAPTRHRIAADDSAFAETAADLMHEMGVRVEPDLPPTIDAGEPWAS